MISREEANNMWKKKTEELWLDLSELSDAEFLLVRELVDREYSHRRVYAMRPRRPEQETPDKPGPGKRLFCPECRVICADNEEMVRGGCPHLQPTPDTKPKIFRCKFRHMWQEVEKW